MRILTSSQPLEVPPPFRSVDDVVAWLAALDGQFRVACDRKGLFVMAYVAATAAIAQGMARGVFRDNDVMARYVIAFANEYRRALADWNAGRRAGVPVAWQQSFEACERRLAIFQCLMLGINAHMSRDLPYAVVEAGIDAGCAACYEDHLRIDGILRRNVPVVRQRIAEIYGAELSLSQRWFGHFADAGIHHGFKDARRKSWEFAELLARAQAQPARIHVDRLIEEHAAREGRRILSAGHHQRVALSNARRFSQPGFGTTLGI